MYRILSLAALLFYFVPLILVLCKKLWNDKFFLFFACYWGFGGLINSVDFIPGFSKLLAYRIGVFYNLADIPFVLAIFHFTTNSPALKKFTAFASLGSLAAGLIELYKGGLLFESLKYSLGIGIVLVLIVVIWEIVRYFQKIEHSNRQNSKVLIFAALLFEYASFIIIYLFDYVIPGVYERQDNFLLYYISSIIALLIASCGYLLFKKYEQQHQESWMTRD